MLLYLLQTISGQSGCRSVQQPIISTNHVPKRTFLARFLISHSTPPASFLSYICTYTPGLHGKARRV